MNDTFSNQAFAEKNGLPFAILCDYNLQVIKTYCVELPNFGGLNDYTVAKLLIFILGKNGVARYVCITEDPTIEPVYKEIESALEKIEKCKAPLRLTKTLLFHPNRVKNAYFFEIAYSVFCA